MADHYNTLKLDQSSTREEIAEAYESFRASIAQYAPGMQLDDDDIQKLFPMVWEARRVLSDPISRREYDLSLALVDNTEQPVEVPVQEEPLAPQSRLSKILNYSGFVVLMALFVFFLFYIAGYML